MVLGFLGYLRLGGGGWRFVLLGGPCTGAGDVGRGVCCELGLDAFDWLGGEGGGGSSLDSYRVVQMKGRESTGR